MHSKFISTILYLNGHSHRARGASLHGLDHGEPHGTGRRLRVDPHLATHLESRRSQPYAGCKIGNFRSTFIVCLPSFSFILFISKTCPVADENTATTGLGPRLRESCRQSHAVVISNSRQNSPNLGPAFYYSSSSIHGWALAWFMVA